MKEIFNEIGINIGLIIAGFSGSVLMAKKRDSWKQQLIAIAGGTLSANYITTIIIDVANIESVNAQHGLAFIVGLSGLKIAERIEAWVIHQFTIKK